MDIIFQKGLPKNDKVEDHVRYLDLPRSTLQSQISQLCFWEGERERERQRERDILLQNRKVWSKDAMKLHCFRALCGVYLFALLLNSEGWTLVDNLSTITVVSVSPATSPKFHRPPLESNEAAFKQVCETKCQFMRLYIVYIFALPMYICTSVHIDTAEQETGKFQKKNTISHNITMALNFPALRSWSQQRRIGWKLFLELRQHQAALLAWSHIHGGGVWTQKSFREKLQHLQSGISDHGAWVNNLYTYESYVGNST